jgi:single-stranded-DNA-specific exonuclease
MRRHGASVFTGPMLTPDLEYDAEILLSDMTQDFFDWLMRCAPFGIGNREPIFMTRDVSLTADVRLIKEKHVCLQLQRKGETMCFSALGWSRNLNWAERCREVELHQGSRIDVAYRLKAKTNPQFPGLELELVDLRVALADSR